MNFANFTPDQRRALLELALLTQFADGHLAATEDQRLQELLARLGFAGEAAIRELDAATGRIRRSTGDSAKMAELAGRLAGQFPDHSQKAHVLDWLGGLAESDRHITAGEAEWLTVVREALQR